MSKAARILQHAARFQWSGPTPIDVYNARGRANIIIRFIRVRQPDRELLVHIGPAYLGDNNNTVVFSGITTDGQVIVKGVLDGSHSGPALAIIERTPARWASRLVG